MRRQIQNVLDEVGRRQVWQQRDDDLPTANERTHRCAHRGPHRCASRDVIGKCKKAPLDACSSFYEVAFFTAPALETLRYVWSNPPCPVLGAERRQREVQALLLQARKGVLQEREDHLPGARGGAG